MGSLVPKALERLVYWCFFSFPFFVYIPFLLFPFHCRLLLIFVCFLQFIRFLNLRHRILYFLSLIILVHVVSMLCIEQRSHHLNNWIPNTKPPFGQEPLHRRPPLRITENKSGDEWARTRLASDGPKERFPIGRFFPSPRTEARSHLARRLSRPRFPIIWPHNLGRIRDPLCIRRDADQKYTRGPGRFLAAVYLGPARGFRVKIVGWFSKCSLVLSNALTQSDVARWSAKRAGRPRTGSNKELATG